MAKEIEKPLTQKELARFETLDKVVAGGKQVWVAVGKALVEIRDEKLYREGYGTFKEYCERQHGFTARRAQQLMEGVKIVENANLCSPPTTEAQARELGKVPKEKRDKVWEKATSEANGKPIKAKAVRRAAREIEREIDGDDLPELVSAALETGDTHHQKALDLLTQLSGVLNEAIGDRDEESIMIGAELLAGYRQQLKTDIKNLRETIKATRPHALCPYCKGKDDTNCEACKSHGWVTEQVLREAPKK